VRLFDDGRVAPLIPQLVKQIDELEKPEQWRLLDEAPLADVETLRQGLLDLHAVVAEGSRGDPVSAAVLRAAGKNGLASAARVARERAGTRMQAVAAELERHLGEAGFRARVLRREGAPESHRWPSDDFLALIEVETIHEWQRNLEALADICRPLLEDRVVFFMAPVRDGRIVASFGVKVISDIFPDDSVGEWPQLPLSLLDEGLAAHCRRGLDGLVEVSGVLASVKRSEVHDDEAAVVEAAMARVNEELQYLSDLAEETDDPLVIEVGGTLLELTRAVEEEAEALTRGSPVPRGIAASIICGFRGEPDDVFWTFIGLASACIEWDVDPAAAWERVQQVMEVTES
jgi:hypothetical protein